jgi:hypothetical protein
VCHTFPSVPQSCSVLFSAFVPPPAEAMFHHDTARDDGKRCIAETSRLQMWQSSEQVYG